MIIAPNLALESNAWLVPRTFLNIPYQFWLTLLLHIFWYFDCNASSTAFTAVHCFQFKKKVLELNTTLNQSSHRTVKHHCLWLQSEHGQQFCKEFAPRPVWVGTNNNDTIPANRSFYCRAKYNYQENYYPAIEGRSHDNFHSCIFIPG